MWAIEPHFFSAEYSGLIAAPGTPKAQTTPSRSRICTAASIARIFAILRSGPMISDVRSLDRRRPISTEANLFPATWHIADFSTLAQVISAEKKWKPALDESAFSANRLSHRR